jgi:hypothetical protein
MPFAEGYLPLTKLSLPKMLPGSVHIEYKRCGKATCRCANGSEHLHGPYFYRHVWENGRQRKEYVPVASVKEVTQSCARFHGHTRSLRAATKGEMPTWRDHNAILKEVEAVWKTR